MSDEYRKRSRFDQTEPDSRRSRFDRRSRSPAAHKSEDSRDRSPAVGDAASRAAAAAAKISATLQAKKGIQHVDVPPILSSSVKAEMAPPSEMYTQDGDYIKDIEINDLRNRYMLTKGSTQKMIKEETGADVTTRGSYYPTRTNATAANPPLYLHVTSVSREGLEKAVAKIEELMTQELPNLVDERRFRRPRDQETQVERDELGRRKWPDERIPVDLEPIPGFNLRAQVVGQGGSYVKHIQTETGCRVQIKGRGSGFIETSTGQESDEPMYLHVAGPDPEMVQQAKEQCMDLLKIVREDYEDFKERGPQRHGGGGGGGDRRDGNRSGSGSHGDRQQSAGYGGGYGDGAQSPQTQASATSPSVYSAAPSATPSNPQDYAALQAQYAQYYAANPSQDPYAPYGGYEAYVRMYQQYYAQQNTGYEQPAAPGAEGQPPPPPPPGSDADAPPPPPSAYSSVPPPPGL